ncbi:MAG: DUF1679 domain-containing protein [Candidatus Delongbacteria bacterium]|nr:DUF1679 domain-containing protein [Candidatus Delongbacteria bacterium]
MKIPRELTEVTPEYLTKILLKNGHIKQGCVESLSIRKDIVGVNSNSAHFEIKYSSDSKGEKNTKFFIKLDKNDNEAKFYIYLAENEINLDVIIKCYYADFDNKAKSSILIFKDYADIHEPPIDLAAFVPRFNVPNDDKYFGMIESLAEFHAHWWEDNSLYKQDSIFNSEMWNNDTRKVIKEWAEDCRKDWNKFLTVEKNWLPKETISLFDNAIDNFEFVWKKYFHSRVLEKKHYTLINGDSYFQQFLCLSKESKEKTKLIDFQDVHINNPARDLIHLIIKKLNPAQRYYKNREQKLLKHYHKTLKRFGVVNYSFEQLMIDYRVELSFILFFSLWDYSYQGSDDPYWWYKFQNVNHAYIDLKCAELFKEERK